MDMDQIRSQLTRYEQKEKDVEKLIQANENELKLVHSECQDKQGLIEALRGQVKEANQRLAQADQAKTSLSVEHEQALAKLKRDNGELKAELNNVRNELNILNDKRLVGELEQSEQVHEMERLKRLVLDKERTIETTRDELATVREQLDKFRLERESEVEGRKQSESLVAELNRHLDDAKASYRTLEADNQKLVQLNQGYMDKISELKDDIEGESFGGERWFPFSFS